jgi:hypothetical protein
MKSISLNYLPLDRIMTTTADTVDGAYSGTEPQKHNNDVGAAPGTFTAVEIFYHRANA